MKTSLLLSTVAVLALYGPANAQTSQQNNVIDQVNLGDVWSNIEVAVDYSKSRVDAVGTSVGNSATGLSDGSNTASVNQNNQGAVETQSHVWTGEVAEEVTSTSSAIANTSVLSGQAGTNAQVSQTNSGHVQAINELDAELTWATTNQTTAAANVSEVSVHGGEISTFADQESTADVFAYANTIAPDVDGFVTNVATAAGNSATQFNTGSDDAFNGAVQTVAANTAITAISDVDVGVTGDISNAAVAAGNQISSDSTDTVLSLGTEGSETFQFNGASVEADSFTQVASFDGIASTSANGVGNSVSSHSYGGDTHLSNTQNNAGPVTSTVTLNSTEFSGGAGLASASAIGNSISATATNGALGSRTEQFNTGSVTARANVNTGHIGSVTASATAIGNAATFSTRANAGQ